ncbi:hypothetical protein PF010_g28805 [Phytophthora fragariae]|uniref:Uncharacterized protein n=1 Tax=Phytophthora fragariae TaxID=53985 RepID=A0A6A3QBU0_9STRA|nr:hypothetical protein PF003_g35849 [Phytophthora fragariae]KAE9063919.1 hypothetical protein PF010_g28805 [Phytophthora fragariae]KAE9065005.1 hypothetical protein PF007_g28991 [Phytophthora fragariae]KAE9073020.1 hypothetical protein PF006_g28808 [Phytophthora fragariae]KAE9172865.1 hypothetical protein PF002_g29463 [Phytophthora fragariae]
MLLCNFAAVSAGPNKAYAVANSCVEVMLESYSRFACALSI